MTEALNINVSSEKLVSFLVEDILDLSQVKSGKFRRVDSTFPVTELFEEVISILEFKAALKGIQIST